MKVRQWIKVFMTVLVLTFAMGMLSGAEARGLVVENGVNHIYNKSGKMVTNVPAYKIKKQYYSVDSQGTATELTGVEKLAAARLVKLKAGGKKSMKNLKKAFAWCASLKYRSNSRSGLSSTEAAEYYGRYGFKRKSGDCNTVAYTFAWMAKVLGYDMNTVQGYVPSGSTGKLQKHAWCTMKTGKKLFYYDPDYNRTYAGKRVKTRSGVKKLGKYCGFKFKYGTSGTYVYKVD